MAANSAIPDARLPPPPIPNQIADLMTFLRILLAAAFAFAFYLLGSKAGTGRYKQVRKNARKAWNDPTVKKARSGTKKLARRNAKKLTKAVHR